MLLTAGVVLRKRLSGTNHLSPDTYATALQMHLNEGSSGGGWTNPRAA